MARVIKSMKQKQTDGRYSSPIPFGVDGIHVDLSIGYNVEEALGSVKVKEKGTVQKQLDDHNTNITNLQNSKANKDDLQALDNRVSTVESNKAEITYVDEKVSDLGKSFSNQLLSYVTSAALNSRLANYYTKQQVDTMLENKFDWALVSTWDEA